MKFVLRAGTTSILLSLIGCAGSDASGATDLGSGQYAVATTQFSPEGQTSLLALVDDPTQNEELDLSRAAEFGGAAALFGPDGRSLFALGSSDAPVLTRYELQRGELMKGQSLSLASYGIGSGFKRPDLVPFVATDKVYWIDDVTMQVVIWDPERMAVTGSFSLEAASRDGWLLELGEAVVRDEHVFVSANYYDAEEVQATDAVVLVLDTAQDELVEVVTSDACAGTQALLLAEDGSVYVASSPYAASLHALQRPSGFPAPCALRILPGELRFDPEFALDLTELTGGYIAGGLVRGSGDNAYVLALHEELLDEPIGPDTDLYAPYEANAWRWWRIALNGTSAELVADAPVGSAATRVLVAGQRDFISSTNFDTGMTTLLVPSADDKLVPGLQMLGYPYGLIRLR